MSEIDVPGHLQAILSEVRDMRREQRVLSAGIDRLAEALDERAPDTARESVLSAREEWNVIHEHRRRLDEQARELGGLRSGVEWLNGEVRSLAARLRALDPHPDNRE